MVAAAVAMRQIRCLGTRHNGLRCDQLLLIVDADLVNDGYAERVEGKCPRCATTYTLADYRVKRI